MRSQVAARVAALMVRPDRDEIVNNVAGNPAGDQTWELNARNILGRLDHNFTPNFKMSHTFYWNRRPSIRNCGGVGGCTTEFSGELEPEKNDSYIGEGFYQRISTHHAHQQFDWVIRNNLLNHSTIAYDRWFMGGNSLSAGVGWPQALFGANQGGLLAQDAGPPVFTFGGNIQLLDRRSELDPIRRPREQSLAVLERPDMGEEPPHDEVRFRVPETTTSRSTAGAPPRAASSTSIGWAPPGTTRPATTSLRLAIRSPRSCSARSRMRLRPSRPVRRSTRRTRPSG